jgi:hypothetical protein
MKITIEPGTTRFTSRGVPLRLWRGVTEDGAPVLAAVVGIAVPAGGVPEGDDTLEPVKDPPVDSVGPNGRTVVTEVDGEIICGWWWV